MPNVGTLNASMYLDTSPYIAGLNQAAGATRSFQQGVSTISFAGFNRGIFATTTLLYGLERIMSSMSKGMEKYSNILGRIGTVADLTAASVSALADSMASLSVYQGVSRTDIMQGMYTAAQAGFQSPAEMRAMASSGAILSRASGKEINVKKSVDLQSGLRQALGIGMNSVTSNRMNDILLKGRDVGRWELDQMAESIGKAATVWGNQFAGKQSGEETLRQLLTVMSTASLAGISPAMTATGTRRIVERTLQLNNTKRGDPLRAALRGVGFTGPNAIENALDQGGIKYLNTLSRITRGGESNELNKLGYQSRDLMVLTAAMRGGGEKLNQAYSDISYTGAAGTTERYGEKMRQTYDYQRDRLRSEWLITSQRFMQATIPLIGQFVNMLESFNKVAQALPDSVKSFTLMLGAIMSMRLALNFIGFRSKVANTGLSAATAIGGVGSANILANGVSANISPSMAAKRLFYSDLRKTDYLSKTGRTVLPLNGNDYSQNVSLPESTGYKTGSAQTQWKGAKGGLSMMGNELRQDAQKIPVAFSAAAGAAGGMLSRFSSGLASTFGPLAQFAIAISAVSKIYEALSYGGKSEVAENGLMKMKPTSSGYSRLNPLSVASHQLAFSASGLKSWLTGDNKSDEYVSEFARSHGYVRDENGIGPYRESGMSSVGAFVNTGQTALAGYRKGTITDALKIAGQESFSPEQREQFSRGGIDFGNFGTVKGYLDEHLKGLGKTAPDSWNSYIQNSPNGIDTAVGLITDALKAAADKINAAADAAAGTFVRNKKGQIVGYVKGQNSTMAGRTEFPDKGYFRQNGRYHAMANGPLQQYEEVGTGRANWGIEAPWKASLPYETTDALVRQRLLSGRQWDIYSATDYSGTRTSLNTGEKNYRAMYDKELANLDERFGGFADQSYSGNMRGVISGQRGDLKRQWEKKAGFVGAKFGGFSDEDSINYMLQQGDEDFAKMKKIRNLLKVLPDLSTMPEEQAMNLFTSYTGRDPLSDTYAKANFDNFRHMDLSKFITTERTRAPTQYASATQFGTAEAYNQLLARPEGEDKMNIAVDKFVKVMDDMKVTREQADKALQDVIKKATIFFNQTGIENIGENLATIASEAQDL